MQKTEPFCFYMVAEQGWFLPPHFFDVDCPSTIFDVATDCTILQRMHKGFVADADCRNLSVVVVYSVIIMTNSLVHSSLLINP